MKSGGWSDPAPTGRALRAGGLWVGRVVHQARRRKLAGPPSRHLTPFCRGDTLARHVRCGHLMARGTCPRHSHLMRNMILTPASLLYRAPRLTCGRTDGAGVFSLKQGAAFEYCHRTCQDAATRMRFGRLAIYKWLLPGMDEM